MQNETINAERSEARQLRKAWIDLDNKYQEMERQFRDLVTICNEYGGGASISHPRYTRQLSAAKKFLENVKEHAPPQLKSESAATDELHGGCCVSSCSFSSSSANHN